MNLEGAVVVVTGGASGIGEATVSELRKRGATAVAWDLNEAAEVVCDVSDGTAVAAAMARTIAERGLPTGFVACAAVGSHDRVEVIAEEDWDRTFAINTRGVMLCMREFVRALKAAGSPGSFVAVTSISSEVADPGMATYSASKAAVTQLVKVAAREQGQHNIRFNAVGPGPTITPMSLGLLDQPGWRDEIIERTPLRELGQPAYVADAICGVLQMDWVTGQQVLADGGASLVTARKDRRP